MTALRKRGFELASPPPIRAAVTTSRMSLVQARPRAASVAPFLRLIDAHFEWPLMFGRLDYHRPGRTKSLAAPRQRPPAPGASRSLVHLLRQITLPPELFDQP